MRKEMGKFQTPRISSFNFKTGLPCEGCRVVFAGESLTRCTNAGFLTCPVKLCDGCLDALGDLFELDKKRFVCPYCNLKGVTFSSFY